MTDALVQVDNLRKDFVVSHAGTGSLKTLLLWWRRKRLERMTVLDGISFQIQRGEALAVVGRNGAGKSTLLSLLARVYKPTSGDIAVRGRLAPLLELGAGFHPDLTGIENIFFNGVILGLTRKEVQARMDQIVAFSELEKQIDAPVRTYSSGMLARLGFSVAVHVDAEVLLVDEVLAVGDYEFEQKCYQKIEEFRGNGGSILFVSHQMDTVRRIADRCIWLEKGKVAAEGAPLKVLSAYGHPSGSAP